MKKRAGRAPERSTSRVRRPWIVVACLSAAALAAWWWPREAALVIEPNPERNVLLVTIDTLRADALGAYGGRALTPNLDGLASHGARFAFAHAHAVVTLPSHASILTGRYPYEHGIRDNTGYRLAATQPTAATRLKSAGYSTGAFIGGFPLDRRFGLGIGFDVYDDRLSPSSPDDSGERERRADAVVGSALEWIEKQPGKWFAWVHLYDPHVRYEAPREWAARFAADPYLAEVSWTDFALGALFERLRSQPRATLVVVTADHGESLGEHGELTHGIFAYEAVLRVPLILAEVDASRQSRAGGVTIDAPVRHVDLLPTVLEAVDAPRDESLPGASLLDLIRSHDGAERPVYFEAMTSNVVRGWAPLRGVLVGREKYIDLPIPELYDLASDPAESANLVPRQPGRSRALHNVLATFDLAVPGRPQQESAETIDRLRSLGYIGGASAAVRGHYTEDDDPKRLISLEQAMTRAAEAYRSGRADEAIGIYRTVIEQRADTEDAYRKLALVYWRTGRPADAIGTLELALRSGVTQREVQNKLAQYLAESGQPGKAIALLEGTAGGDPDALIALGNAYMMSGRLHEARQTFERLLEADPGNGLAWENIGVSHLQAREYAAAERSLRRAIEVDPALAGAHTALGVALASTGRRGEAIDAWKRAVTLDPSELNALYNLTLNLAEAGRADEARTYGQRFLALAPPALQRDAAAVRRAIEPR